MKLPWKKRTILILAVKLFLMDIKIKNYRLLIKKNDFMFLNISESRNKNIILNKLETVGELFNSAQFEWYLVGGLASDLQLGRVTRSHKDIDIQISSKNVDDFYDFIESKGYSVFKKINEFHIFNGGFAVLCKCNKNECLPSQLRTIKIIKNNIKDSDSLPYIDVFFKEENKNETTMGYRGKVITLNYPYEGPEYLTSNGKVIKTRNPIYSYLLKINSNRFIDRFDSNNLEKVISKEDLNKLKNNSPSQ